MTNIYLAGEGANELGSYAIEQCYRPPSTDCGVIEAYMRRVQSSGWTIVDAACWKNLCKSKATPTLRPGGPIKAETRAVEILALQANEAHAQILAFIRDQDDDTERAEHINQGIASAKAKFPDMRIAGASAISCIEAWILAFQGKTKTESLGKVAAQTKLGFNKDTKKMVAVVDSADLSKIASDAKSLRDWTNELRQHLTSTTQ